jgi:hypothetical protein
MSVVVTVMFCFYIADQNPYDMFNEFPYLPPVYFIFSKRQGKGDWGEGIRWI